ncbi:MAG: hypothetical protein L0Z47_11030 [Actinobacteria bacterium]|nr:hypothetical protein [Actinomycetota bacterium]
MICSPWATVPDLDECCTSNATTTQKTDALLAASEILYALSGRQYPGLCAETVRPCSGGSPLPGFSWDRWSYPTVPLLVGGNWLNIGPACGCHIAWDCACSGIPQVNLGRSDVTQINTVVVDGVTLSAANYRLDHGRWLVRTDGEFWPCCQDLAKNIGEEGTWHIELEFGVLPPQAGIDAVIKLACEMAKAWVGAECDLPERVTSIVRRGVSMTLIDPQTFLSEGKTGLYEVDLFLSAVNPNGLARCATVWSPEVKGRGRRVGAIGS